MPLQSSGAISLSNVAVELGRAATANTSLNESAVRGLAGVASGAISLSNLYGKGSFVGVSGIGYLLGGWVGGFVTSTNGIRFDTQVAQNPAATLTGGRNRTDGCQSSTKGFAAGGGTGTPSLNYYTNTMTGFVFSTETYANPSAVLATARNGITSSNSTAQGFWMGGYFGGTNTRYNEIDGIQFSTETATNPAAALSQLKERASGLSSSTRGYAAGGIVPNGGGLLWATSVSGLRFDTEAAITAAGSLPSAVSWAAGFNSSDAGYLAGGDTGSGSNTEIAAIAKMTFSTETTGTLAATLPSTRIGATGVNSSVRGYISGGYHNTNGYSSTNYIAFAFSSDTTEVLSATLTGARYETSGVQSGGYL